MLKYLKYGIEKKKKKKKKKRGTRAESVIERDCENAVEGLGNSNTTDRTKQRDKKMCCR